MKKNVINFLIVMSKTLSGRKMTMKWTKKLDTNKNLQMFSLAPTYQIPESDKISLKYILDWVW